MARSIPRWATTVVLAVGVPVLFLLVSGEDARSQVGPLACNEREMVVIDREQLIGQEMNLALADVGLLIGVSPQSLVTTVISETEAAAAFPTLDEPALVVSLEGSSGGWSATHIEGCPELVLTVDELHPNLGVQ